jgi:hypothetical protein
MFTPDELEAYDRHFGVWNAQTRQERKLAHEIDRHLLRPLELLDARRYVEAIELADSTLELIDTQGLRGMALKRAVWIWRSTIKSIDDAWKTRAFAGCVVRESRRLTLVNHDDGEEVWLFRSPVVLPGSHDARDARHRAGLIETGTSAVQNAREGLLAANAHVGPDEDSLIGIEAHQIVSEAVQRRLLDWEDAEWWWPRLYVERCPALDDGDSLLDEVLEVSYPRSVSDA